MRSWCRVALLIKSCGWNLRQARASSQHNTTQPNTSEIHSTHLPCSTIAPSIRPCAKGRLQPCLSLCSATRLVAIYTRTPCTRAHTHTHTHPLLSHRCRRASPSPLAILPPLLLVLVPPPAFPSLAFQIAPWPCTFLLLLLLLLLVPVVFCLGAGLFYARNVGCPLITRARAQAQFSSEIRFLAFSQRISRA